MTKNKIWGIGLVVLTVAMGLGIWWTNSVVAAAFRTTRGLSNQTCISHDDSGCDNPQEWCCGTTEQDLGLSCDYGVGGLVFACQNQLNPGLPCNRDRMCKTGSCIGGKCAECSAVVSCSDGNKWCNNGACADKLPVGTPNCVNENQCANGKCVGVHGAGGVIIKYCADCGVDADCGVGKVCKVAANGLRSCQSGQCSVDADCGQYHVCDSGQCVGCTEDRDCNSSVLWCDIEDGLCKAKVITGGGPCDPATPSMCEKNACNPATSLCVGCAADADCGNNKSCGANGTCIGASSAGVECTTEEDCTSADQGHCLIAEGTNTGMCVLCRNDNDCNVAAGETCQNSNCVGRAGTDNNGETQITHLVVPLEAPLMCAGGPCTYVQMIAKIIDYVLGLVGLLAVAALVYGGIMYITSAGNKEKTETGKKVITGAIMGLIIVFAALIIIKFVISTIGG